MKFKKENSVLPLAKQYTIRFTLNGIFWLLFAIFNLPDNRVLNRISSFFLLFAALCMLVTFFPNRETTDEMSMNHITKAMSLSLDITVILLMGIGVIGSITDQAINYFHAYGFVIAASQIISGLLFHKLEKGDI